jgi:hypothetical protein
MLALPLILATCNRPDLVDPTPTPTPKPLTLDEIETAVVATLVAEGQMTAAVRPSDTPVPTEEPTATPSDTPEGPTETPTETPSCLVVSNALNLRYGPGLVYAPPLQTLSAGTVLLPFAKNGDGSWLEVQLQGESTTGWVSSGGQFVSCNFDPSGLPLGQIPPTPTPTITPTPAPTLTPSPTDKPTSAPPTNTPCPKFTNPSSISTSVNVGTNEVTVTWGSQGGCGSITGIITATIKGERSAYQTYSIKGQSGKLTDKPPNRGCGSWDIIYVLTLQDSSGQTLTTSTSANIYWLC